MIFRNFKVGDEVYALYFKRVPVDGSYCHEHKDIIIKDTISEIISFGDDDLIYYHLTTLAPVDNGQGYYTIQTTNENTFHTFNDAKRALINKLQQELGFACESLAKSYHQEQVNWALKKLADAQRLDEETGVEPNRIELERSV